MKKILIVLLLAMTTFIFAGNDYTTQEVFNLVLDSNTLGIHGYTTQDVLNLVYDSTNEALKVTVNGGDVEVGTLNFTDATELTIATGEVTITQSVHTIDGETDADDDLVTISGGVEGDFLILYPENAARNITLINSTGNILTSNGLDTVIPDDGMAMLYYNGTNWLAFISIGADITISGDITVGGNAVIVGSVTAGSFVGVETNKIKDADGDTYVDVEQTSDCDSIRFKAGGTYVMSMTSDGTVLEEPLNAGKLQLTADGGVMTIADKAVVTSSADETYWFKQDGNEVLGINATGDGSDGVTGLGATLNGDLIVTGDITQKVWSGAMTDTAPTDAELDAITSSTPAGVGSGWTAIMVDSDGAGGVYRIVSDGTNWYYIQLTVAA